MYSYHSKCIVYKYRIHKKVFKLSRARAGRKVFIHWILSINPISKWLIKNNANCTNLRYEIPISSPLYFYVFNLDNYVPDITDAIRLSIDTKIGFP